MMVERRQAARSRIFKGAAVVFNGRQSVMDCTVRNWSQSGAMLRMSDWIALPPTFEIDARDHSESVRVRQCWRHGDDVGVIFLTEDEAQPHEPVSLDQARESRLAKASR